MLRHCDSEMFIASNDRKNKVNGETMCDRQIVQSIIGDKACIASKSNFSYVGRLFPGWQGESSILLICKTDVSPTNVSCQESVEMKKDLWEATDHDLTGSPLPDSFEETSLNTTIVSQKQNWSKDEECHFPVTNLCASPILNLCLEELGSKKWTMPVFVLCKGSDKERTVLLGTFVQPGDFSTMKVCLAGVAGASKIRDCNLLMQEHLMLSAVPEREISITVSSTYDFCGSSAETLDWSENEKGNFEGYLSVEVCWNLLSFLPPMSPTSNSLIVQIAAGRKNSPLGDLWNELLLLDKYLTILESYQGKKLSSRYSILPLTFPRDFDTPFKSGHDIMEKLDRLLTGDDDFENDDKSDENMDCPFENGTDLQDNPFLSIHLRELSLRKNLDFTHRLWQLIIGSSDYAEMTDCLHTVFEEIVENHYKPQINDTQSTRFGILIDNLNSQKTFVPSLAGTLPLELVIDMGMDKIFRDYKYLLLSANLTEMHGLREKLSNVPSEEFSADKYRKKLVLMAQIHICLEFLLLAQNNLDCSMEISYVLFDFAMKHYTSAESPIKSFADLIDNTIYTLRAPGVNALLKEIVKSSPSTWCGTLSSTRKASKLTTTTQYSLLPIFPPNIYTPDDPIDGEESYYVTKAISSSYTMC